jgi:hypothetical protein
LLGIEGAVILVEAILSGYINISRRRDENIINRAAARGPYVRPCASVKYNYALGIDAQPLSALGIYSNSQNEGVGHTRGPLGMIPVPDSSIVFSEAGSN